MSFSVSKPTAVRPQQPALDVSPAPSESLGHVALIQPTPSPASQDALLGATPSPNPAGATPTPSPGDVPVELSDVADMLCHVVEVVPQPFNMYTARGVEDLSGKKKAPRKRVGFFQLFRFADRLDKILLFFGTLGGIGTGIMMPLFTIFMGNMVNSFKVVGITASEASAYANYNYDLMGPITSNAHKLLIMGAVSFFTRFVLTSAFTFSATRQCTRMRIMFFQSALSQEMGWFDNQHVGELTTRVTDITKIQDGMGEKVGMFVMAFSTFVCGWVIGFVKGWKMSLVLLSMVPLLVVVMGLLSTAYRKLVLGAQDFYAKAGFVAEEILSSIRTVVAFSIHRSALARYDANLLKTLKMGYKKGLAMGSSFGALFFVLFSAYGLAFWYGSTLVEKGEMSAGSVLVVLMSIMMGAMSLSQLGAFLNSFLEAMGCAYDVFGIIDRPSLIDSRDMSGEDVELTGDIEFNHVYFRYPTRPEVEVLRGFSLHVRKGQTVALVGSSGSGKSTIVGLLERFYDVDPNFGEVLLDGHPISTIRLSSLRSQIGIVTQEPVLFATTIRQNIALGSLTELKQEEIETAAKRANAHDFIMKLPLQYETLVGERGVQLSGGQKQRIAIARALVRRPKLLIFDEATSALDTESEKTVQAAIDEVTHGNTCIIVAHRLSTVRHADVIVAMREGRIVERGTHDELMAQEGLYYNLVRKQQLQDAAGERRKKKEKKEDGVDSALVKKAEIEKTLAEDLSEEQPTLSTLLRAFKMLKPDYPLVGIASIAAIVNGAIFPCFALIMSEVLSILLYITPGSDADNHVYKIRVWALMFVVLGFASFLANFFQFSCIDIGSERLTKYLRYESFKAMLRQEIAFFDDKKNMTGILTTRLATDATLINGITGSQICQVIQIISALASGIIIGFTGSWKLAIVILCCVPPQVAATSVHMRYMTKYQQDNKKAYEQSGQVANEALENPRTVATLCREQFFVDKYAKELDAPMEAGKKATLFHAIGGAVISMSQLWLTALAFWYGGKLSGSENLSFKGMMRSQMGIMMGAQTLGQITSFFPDYGKALAAAHHIFELFDREPAITAPDGLAQAKPGEQDEVAQKLAMKLREECSDAEKSGTETIADLRGDIEFKDVAFRYPTRPQVRVLEGLCFKAAPRQTVALVGSSGCGKSTSVALLERFYSPLGGQIFIDGRPIESLNISWLRGQIGLVSQEPTLFATTILENIRYGKPEATLEDVVAAAKMANAHTFISGFPQGYETSIAEKGSTLSGGQKQRIAIARALVRNPKILLLDEATSALDTASEAVVQEALDRARDGRTTIVIAHRLSTIVNSNLIVVIHEGRAVESGTHDELMALRGHYYALACNQMK